MVFVFLKVPHLMSSIFMSPSPVYPWRSGHASSLCAAIAYINDHQAVSWSVHYKPW